MPEGHVRPVSTVDSEIMVPVDIQGQYVTLSVDTLAIENSVSAEYDTSSVSAPQTVVTPSSGKKIETRGVYIFTDSNAGEIWLEFPTSGITVAKLYCSVFRGATLPKVKFTGAVGEALQVNWSGLSTGAKIFVIVVYREV